MPFVLGDILNEVADKGVCLAHLQGVVVGTPAVVCTVRGIRQGQLVGDNLGVGDHVLGVVPQVWIDLTVQMLAQHCLGQQIGFIARTPEKTIGRGWWDFLQR